uniref:Evasin n=1 Tax=Amblyomma maculatum TaxID=34609 RepID=G3MT15_AMBMU
MHTASFLRRVFLGFTVASFVKYNTAIFEELFNDTYDYFANYSDSYEGLENFTPLPQTSSEEYIPPDGDFCDISGLTTEYGLTPVGCNVTCLSGNYSLLEDGKLCINYTEEEAQQLKDFTNLTCPLGVCLDGICENCDRSIWCWKKPVMSIGVPN